MSGGFLERRIPGKKGEGAPRIMKSRVGGGGGVQGRWVVESSRLS